MTTHPAPRFRRGKWLAACLGLTALLACNATRLVDPATPAPEESPAGGWQVIAPGIERRVASLPAQSLLRQGSALLIRLDPAVATVRVHYSPGAPHDLADWGAQLPGAALIVNAGFFDEADRALGLLVSDGQAFGQSFAGFGGMLEVGARGLRVRSLVSEPYQGEVLYQAVQAFPMLIEAGGVPAPQGNGFDERAWRAWVGQDRAGRIVFGVTHTLISLAELQAWLLEGDLDLAIAFALDGGRSAGMALNVPGASELLPALDQVPAVIAVYPP